MFKVSQFPHTWCQWNWDQTGSDHGPDHGSGHGSHHRSKKENFWSVKIKLFIK